MSEKRTVARRAANSIVVNMTSIQWSDMGRALHKFYYGNSGTWLSLAPGHSGYPHNGGEHTMRVSGYRDEVVAFIELFRDELGAKIQCNAILDAIAAGHKNVVLKTLECVK